MSTTSKLGADMLTVPRDLLQDLTDDVADYAVSRTFKDRETTWRSDLLKRADELLARQPAAIDKQEAATESGECQSCVDGKCVTGNRCVTLGWDAYECGRCKDSGYLPDGHHCQWCAAPLGKEASKPDPLSEEGQREIYGRSPVEPAAPSVEQDERVVFDKALMAYAMEFSESIDAGRIRAAHKRVMELFEARAASTSANVASKPTEIADCPHAAPHRYCYQCVVSPCPIGLGEKK